MTQKEFKLQIALGTFPENTVLVECLGKCSKRSKQHTPHVYRFLNRNNPYSDIIGECITCHSRRIVNDHITKKYLMI